MQHNFYTAFVAEMQKIAADNPSFDEWRKHFETTGEKSMKKRPSASEAILGKKRFALGKKATIIKRIRTHASPSVVI